MNSETPGFDTSLQALFESSGRQLTRWQTAANLIGACIVTSYFVFFDRVFPAMQIQNTFYVVGVLFPILVLIAISAMRYWQKDLNLYIRLHSQNREIEADLQKSAQRKILDVPHRSALVSLFCWFLAAITMTTYSLGSKSNGADTLAGEIVEGLRVFAGCIIGGIIVAAIVFFITEAKCRQLWPYFFPEGGLVRTPGTFRLKLRIRMFVIFLLASILPLILMAVLSYNKARMMLVMDPTDVIQSLLYLTAFLLIVTLAVAIILSRMFSTGIIDPVGRMEAAMAKVEKGDLTATVTVNSNDELGVLAENFNQMTEGLKDRYRMQQALDLAKEVQQSLLPEKDPQFPGLDIAGKSIYCDETGGDYFDFFDNIGANANSKGVSSAALSLIGRYCRCGQ
jgi:sigma-B regulation protein RsbU (phosphoserine phosphatase)